MIRRHIHRATAIALISLLVVLPLGAAASQDLVAYNTKTHKYHCLTCHWAKVCTRNCVKLTREEAVRRGGVACKICGGTCE